MKGEILLSAVALNLLFAAEILAKEAKLETVDIVEQVRHDERDYGAKELVKGTTRLNLTARQTPQSVDVITEAKLKDMNIKDYQTLLANIPGVTLNRMDETIRPMSRGFFIDYYLIDSMPSLGGFGLEATDMSMIAYDRVEVVRGANGLLAGAGIGHVFQVLLFPAAVVFGPEGRLVNGADPVCAFAQFFFGNVLVVFALLVHVLRFAVHADELQRLEDVQAVGFNRLGGGVVVAIGEIGFQHLVGGDFCGGIDPKFVRLGEGSDGNQCGE